ncbi:hypothetical protein H1D31_00735 [Alishewanella sp. BS5-314]|uniref:hypothetical protein n=1 Tax=Alishewanella sp. BS5-314 TaxID=2755587 RepID=UPI0021BB175C|nr:hypothetical protein [Alishewanella sp. BS5-314]MCT8124563.1 hypothetical protein [Alishewanella sp. BS5-314]
MKRLFLLGAVFLSAAADAETLPTQHAKGAGFNACLDLVDGLSKFVIKDNNHGSLATWNNNEADTRLFNALIAVKYPDGHSAAMLNVSPGKTGRCDGSYTTVFYVDKSCSVAREINFSDWKYSGELAGLVVLKNPSGSVDRLLMPAGNGCIAISTEVVYQ